VTRRYRYRLKILGVSHKVDVVTSNVLDQDNTWMGRASEKDAVIQINRNMPRQIQAGTLIHEIIEILNGRMELQLEHQQITALDAGLTQVLLDNPDLLKFLLGSVK